MLFWEDSVAESGKCWTLKAGEVAPLKEPVGRTNFLPVRLSMSSHCALCFVWHPHPRPNDQRAEYEERQILRRPGG
jgi:hypothetical protein